jgi:hypothetical protein
LTFAGVGRGITRTGALGGFWGFLECLQSAAQLVALCFDFSTLRLDFFPPSALIGQLI